ncbi:MAG: lipopolysaccharide biosynthesis protein [Candidatus Ventricola sp.]
MNRTQRTIRNGAVSLMGQAITILLSFISRKVFIQYLGVELLGLNSTFASLLSTLSLAELGFQQVIVFHLYGALARDDREQINALVNIYKLVYRCIGILFIGASVCCVPFLQAFLSDIEVTHTVRAYFLIQALTSSCTYFLAYKRNILYADQNGYISGLIDTVINTAATLLCIAMAVLTRNYIWYLIVDLVRTILSNLVVHRVCARRYPYLHPEKTDWGLLRRIAASLKDVVLERLAGYIYGSTDNLIISMFISTVQVGFLNNYTMIISHIKRLMKSLSTPLIPALGNKIALEGSSARQLETFRMLEQAYFWLTGLAVVPVYVLADSFIRMYLGERFILPRRILLLLCVDLYVHINQDACLSFLTASGLFRKRRNISIGGAMINIVVSLLLMKPLGTAGILAGTAVSQLYYWAARSVVALRQCLKQSWRVLSQYWLRQAGLLCIILAATGVSRLITRNVRIVHAPVTFLVSGIVCEGCFALLAFLCCRGIEAERRMEGIVLGVVLRRLRNKA